MMMARPDGGIVLAACRLDDEVLIAVTMMIRIVEDV